MHTSAPYGQFEIGGGSTKYQAAVANKGFNLAVDGNWLGDNSTGSSGTLSGATFSSFAPETLIAANTNVTTTNANTVYVGGAPVNGTNETFTNASSLYIDTSSVSGSGNGVGNSYGIYVNAPSGASYNYSATFMGGNVGPMPTFPAFRMTLPVPSTSKLA